MQRYAKLWAAAILTACGLVLTTSAQQPAEDAVDEEMVLLLRNGETMQGRVYPKGDRYEVVVPGGEILVRKNEVVCCCRDLQEVYQQKLKLLRNDSIQERLDLVQWCHRVGLADAAAYELDAARQLSPQHPLIPLIERRLSVAAEPAKRQANPKPSTGPSSHELDLMIRGMPPRTVEMFAQSIQPLLLNNCATAGCHGQTGAKGLQMFRSPPGVVPSRRLTQRNLYAVLGYIDQDSPGNSPILTIPKHPHGTARAPIFTDHQYAQYKQLVDWCYRVAQTDPTVVQASFQERADAPSSPHPLAMAKNRKRTADTGQPAALPMPRKKAAAPPSDPFDPEAFNRQFAPDSPGTAAPRPLKPADRAADPNPLRLPAANNPNRQRTDRSGEQLARPRFVDPEL